HLSHIENKRGPPSDPSQNRVRHPHHLWAYPSFPGRTRGADIRNFWVGSETCRNRQRLSTQVVERGHRLPGLSPIVQRLERGWNWRLERHHLETGLHPGPWRQRHLAESAFRLAERRQWLRHPRLPQGDDRVRHHVR